MHNVIHDNTARVHARWLAFFAAIAVGAGLTGCGSDAPDASALEEGSQALSIPYPADPDTLIRYTVVGQDAHGERTVHEGTITKAEQWRRMMMPDALEGSAQAGPSQGDEAVGEATQAIENQVCWHGSPIALNDQPGWAGNYLCFDNMDGMRNILDIDSVSPGFTMRSAYSSGSPVLMSDTTKTLQIKWCTADFNLVNPYTGPRIEFLATGSSRWGICHF